MNKEKENKKEMTIDDLARILQNGLLKMDNGFKNVDKRFDKVEERLTNVESKIDNIEANLNKKIDKIDHNTLTYRVEKLEKKLV